MKVLWISADIATSTATIIAGTGSSTVTGDGPMPSTSYGWPGGTASQMARYGQLLIVAVGYLVRFRIDAPDPHAPAAATITYTLEMDHAEHFCGTLGNYPFTNYDVPCSVSSPRWDGISGIGINPLNKLAYALDMDAMTVTSVPIPDLSTGNVELVAGPLGCGSASACSGSTVGAFGSTRFISPHYALLDAQLLPKFYIGDHGNYRLVEMDLNTQTSSIYIGTNAAGPSNDATGFNNKVRTDAVMNVILDAAVSNDYILPAHHTRFQPKVSRTTNMATLLIDMASSAACRTNAHYNGIVYCAYASVGITSYTVPGGVDNGAITGGAFSPDLSQIAVNVDTEMKVLGSEVVLMCTNTISQPAQLRSSPGQVRPLLPATAPCPLHRTACGSLPTRWLATVSSSRRRCGVSRAISDRCTRRH